MKIKKCHGVKPKDKINISDSALVGKFLLLFLFFFTFSFCHADYKTYWNVWNDKIIQNIAF